MSHNEYARDLYSANLVTTIFNSINANDQQIDEELMQEFGSAHAAYQDVPEVVNTVHDNSSQVDLDIEDGMLIELGLHPVTFARLRGRGAENTCDTIHYLLHTHPSVTKKKKTPSPPPSSPPYPPPPPPLLLHFLNQPTSHSSTPTRS